VNPFPGLRPYEASETHLFFGRDAQVDALLRRFRDARLLAVVGTSGCGKSSLVRAGLLPALAGGYLTDVGSRWRIAVLRPGTDPVDRLAHALARDQGPDDVAQVETTLRRSSLGLIEAVRLSPAAGDATLVVVDQFEELFRFQGTDADPAESAAFVKLLLEASAQRALPIYVLLTMRSDFLGDCAQFHGLPEALNEGQYLVPQMTRDQRREAVGGPAAIAGAAATPRLMQRVLNDAGDDPQALPVLQHALTRTFARWLEAGGTGPLDLEQYEGAGGMADALDRHADEVFDALPDAERPVAERVFRALTERDASGRERRRPARLRALFAITGAASDADRARVRSVVRTFAAPGSGFLSVSRPPDADEDDAVVDITHESLIRAWTQLRVWVRDEALSADWFKRIVRSAELHARKEEGHWRDPGLAFAIATCERNRWSAPWAEQYGGGFDPAMRFLQESARAQDEERQAERERVAEAHETQEHALRTRRLAGLAGAGVLVFAALAGVAWVGWTRTNRALKLAEERRQEAVAVRKEAVDQRSTLLHEQRELVEQVEDLQKDGEQLASVVRSRVPAASRPSDILSRALRVGDRTADRLGLVGRKRPFGPGYSVSGEASGIGSACCLVRREGRPYLLGLTLVFGTHVGSRVLQPGTGARDSEPVARLAFAGGDPLTSAALAELLPGLQFDPRLVVTNRPFAGLAPSVTVKQRLRLLGRGSGYTSGEVLAVTAAEIVATGMSTGGDAGAPVFDDDERLVGVLWGSGYGQSSERISRVIPIRRLLAEAGAELETSGATVTGARPAQAN
jgi:energy-coupling factor transporter ATP-binding protein EcfA2